VDSGHSITRTQNWPAPSAHRIRVDAGSISKPVITAPVSRLGLRADRRIERRDRLIERDELRRQSERAGRRDTLPLPAGEFVGNKSPACTVSSTSSSSSSTRCRTRSAVTFSFVISGSAMIALSMRGLSEA
jgi:hypothetical protein